MNYSFLRKVRGVLALGLVLTGTYVGVAPNVYAAPNAQAGPHASIDCGSVLDQPGFYRLNQDLVCSDVAIEIVSDDVHLDLGGYSVTCDQTGDAQGIRVGAVAGVTVRNGTVTACNVGVFLFGTEDSSVRRMLLTGNNFDIPPDGDASGLLLNGANGNEIIGNTMSGNGHGVSLFDSSGNRLIKNNSSDNGYDGLRLLPLSEEGGSNDNHIVNNRLDRNGFADPEFPSSGVQWFGPSTGNVFLRNQTNDNNLLGVLVYGVPADNYPLPADNLIRSNTATGNVIFADYAEFDLGTFDTPETCQNTWQNNTFDTALGPENCIQ